MRFRELVGGRPGRNDFCDDVVVEFPQHCGHILARNDAHGSLPLRGVSFFREVKRGGIDAGSNAHIRSSRAQFALTRERGVARSSPAERETPDKSAVAQTSWSLSSDAAASCETARRRRGSVSALPERTPDSGGRPIRAGSYRSNP